MLDKDTTDKLVALRKQLLREAAERQSARMRKRGR